MKKSEENAGTKKLLAREKRKRKRQRRDEDGVGVGVRVVGLSPYMLGTGMILLLLSQETHHAIQTTFFSTH